MSPAAQNVLSGGMYRMCAGESEDYAREIAAAFAEALADQVARCDESGSEIIPLEGLIRMAERQHLKGKILAIAAELRGDTTETP